MGKTKQKRVLWKAVLPQGHIVKRFLGCFPSNITLIVLDVTSTQMIFRIASRSGKKGDNGKKKKKADINNEIVVSDTSRSQLVIDTTNILEFECNIEELTGQSSHRSVFYVEEVKEVAMDKKTLLELCLYEDDPNIIIQVFPRTAICKIKTDSTTPKFFDCPALDRDNIFGRFIVSEFKTSMASITTRSTSVAFAELSLDEGDDCIKFSLLTSDKKRVLHMERMSCFFNKIPPPILIKQTMFKFFKDLTALAVSNNVITVYGIDEKLICFEVNVATWADIYVCVSMDKKKDDSKSTEKSLEDLNVSSDESEDESSSALRRRRRRDRKKKRAARYDRSSTPRVSKKKSEVPAEQSDSENDTKKDDTKKDDVKKSKKKRK